MSDIEHYDSPEQRAEFIRTNREQLSVALRTLEVRVLGTVMQQPDRAAEFVVAFEPDDFFYNDTREVCEAIIRIVERNDSPDMLVVQNELAGSGRIERVGNTFVIECWREGDVSGFSSLPMLDEMRRRRHAVESWERYYVDLIAANTDPDEATARVIAALSGKVRASDREYDYSTFRSLPVPPYLVGNVLPSGFSILYGAYKSGKAQPLDEPVLTPDGWTQMGALAVGDAVVGLDGSATTVIATHDIAERDCMIVTTTDGASTRASVDHLWTVRIDGRLRTVTTSTLAELLHRPVYLPVVAPVDMPHVEHWLDPYVLGVLLGDGTFRAGNVRFTNGDTDVVERTVSRLPGEISAHVKPISNAYEVGLSDVDSSWQRPSRLTVEARRLELMGEYGVDKHIPDEYLVGSVEQRVDLLNGLLDTDGGMNGKSLCFYTSSPRLRDGVVELVRSLGGVVVVREQQGEHRASWTLTMRLPDSIEPFTCSRKRAARAAARVANSRQPTSRVASVEPCGKMLTRCITVDAPDGLYVTNDYIATHNSFVALSLAWAIATGGTWASQHTVHEPGPVVYLAGEGVADLSMRAGAMETVHHGRPDDDRLIVVEDRFALSTPSGAARLRLLAERYSARLIVVDTWARYAGVSSENDAAEVSRAVNAMEDVARDGTSVMLVHHANAEGGLRGSTALAGAAESAMRCDKDDDADTMTLSSAFTRRGRGFESIDWKWRTVPPSAVIVPLRRQQSAESRIDSLVASLQGTGEMLPLAVVRNMLSSTALIAKFVEHDNVREVTDDAGVIVGYTHVPDSPV